MKLAYFDFGRYNTWGAEITLMQYNFQIEDGIFDDGITVVNKIILFHTFEKFLQDNGFQFIKENKWYMCDQDVCEPDDCTIIIKEPKDCEINLIKLKFGL